MPTMVLNPDGKEILIAAKDEPVFKVGLQAEDVDAASCLGDNDIITDVAKAALDACNVEELHAFDMPIPMLPTATHACLARGINM